MPTRKKSQSIRRAGSEASRTGPLPPYGDPIRAAIARGDLQEMRRVALSARRHLTEVQSALAALDEAISKIRS